MATDRAVKKTNSRPTEILKLGDLAGGKIDLEGGKWILLKKNFNFFEFSLDMLSHLQKIIGEIKSLDEIIKEECWD